MGSLGISVDDVIEAKTGSYLDTLDEENRESYKEKLKEASQEQIQAKIDEAEALLESITTTCNGIISNCTSWSVQIPTMAVPDPMAPKSSVAVLASLTTSVQTAKGNISVANSQMSQLTQIVSMLGVPIPSIVGQTQSLINTASNALDAIPL